MINSSKISYYQKLLAIWETFHQNIAKFSPYQKIGGTWISIISLLYTLFYPIYIFTFSEKSSSEGHIVYSKDNTFHQILTILGIVTGAYNAFLVMMFFLIKYLRTMSDPYKIIMQNLVTNYKKIHNEVLKHDINEDEFYSRELNINNLAQDLLILTQLGKEAWGTLNVSELDRYSMYENWHSINSQVFRIICDKGSDEPIGYICALPMQYSGYTRHTEGHIRQFDLGTRHISTSYMGNSHVYVQALYLRPNYQASYPALKTAVIALLNSVAKFTGNKKTFTVYGEGFTPACAKFLHELGFRKTVRFSVSFPNSKRIYDFEYPKPGPNTENIHKHNMTMEMIAQLAKV